MVSISTSISILSNAHFQTHYDFQFNRFNRQHLLDVEKEMVNAFDFALDKIELRVEVKIVTVIAKGFSDSQKYRTSVSFPGLLLLISTLFSPPS